MKVRLRLTLRLTLRLGLRLTKTEEPPALSDLIFAVTTGFGLRN